MYLKRTTEDHLKSYLSRIYPHHHEQYEDRMNRNLLFWSYINVDQDCIGSVWLEKENTSDLSATLGIFIYNEASQGKGIGAYVIKQSVKTSAVLLDIKRIELRVRAKNTRAYNCYKKCGFHETGRYIKASNIEVVQMELLLDDDFSQISTIRLLHKKITEFTPRDFLREFILFSLCRFFNRRNSM